MQTPKVSIIVPVYNAEPYLRRCLDSILAQTFTDFEAVLVDDGSTDQSGAICDEYAKIDKRLKVVHQCNQGVSVARNNGLEISKGNWISFVDADDYVSSEYLQHLYGGLTGKDDGNILVWGSIIAKNKIKKQLPQKAMKGGEAAVYIMKNNILDLAGPVSKLFSSSLIFVNNIKFPENISMGEDAIFLQRYLNVVDTVAFIADIDYYVHDTKGSLTKRMYDFCSEWDCFITWKNLMTDYVKKYHSYFLSPNEIIWNNRIGYTFNRCLFCVAYQNPAWSLVRQWKTLKKIPRSEIKAFRECYHTCSWSEKIYQLIIGYRMYLLFVLIINRNNLTRWLKS